MSDKKESRSSKKEGGSTKSSISKVKGDKKESHPPEKENGSTKSSISSTKGNKNILISASVSEVLDSTFSNGSQIEDRLFPNSPDNQEEDLFIKHGNLPSRNPIEHDQLFSYALDECIPDNERAIWEHLDLDGRDEKPKQYEIEVGIIELIMKFLNINGIGLRSHNGSIYAYNGSFWKEVDVATDFKPFLSEAAEILGLNKWKARHHRTAENLFDQFSCVVREPDPVENENEALLNFPNGTLVVANGRAKLREHRSKDFLTHQMPFEYDPRAECPQFNSYLNYVLPGKDAQNLLSEYIGYIFRRDHNEEKALILYGPGGNGKSVFYNIITALFGSEFTSSYSLDKLTDNTGYFLAKIQNKWVNFCSEINSKQDAAITKALISGETVTARLPYKEPFMMSNYAKMIFNANELPKSVEHTFGYFRRWIIIPFTVTIPSQKKDKYLASRIIKDELPGILNWALSGLYRLEKQGHFTHCESSKKILDQYKEETDNVHLFLNEEEFRKIVADEKMFNLLKSYKKHLDSKLNIYDWTEELMRFFDKHQEYNEYLDSEFGFIEVKNDKNEERRKRLSKISVNAYDWIKLKDLYEKYQTFCMNGGFKPLNKTNFLRRVQRLGYVAKKDSSKVRRVATQQIY